MWAGIRPSRMNFISVGRDKPNSPAAAVVVRFSGIVVTDTGRPSAIASRTCSSTFVTADGRAVPWLDVTAGDYPSSEFTKSRAADCSLAESRTSLVAEIVVAMVASTGDCVFHGTPSLYKVSLMSEIA